MVRWHCSRAPFVPGMVVKDRPVAHKLSKLARVEANALGHAEQVASSQVEFQVAKQLSLQLPPLTHFAGCLSLCCSNARKSQQHGAAARSDVTSIMILNGARSRYCGATELCVLIAFDERVVEFLAFTP